ncbi:hypothetical protein [Calothrix sp. NIES-3974]|nr:hypothetical protein [Calothrix sp. NIES-3974]
MKLPVPAIASIRKKFNSQVSVWESVGSLGRQLRSLSVLMGLL